MTRVWKHSLTPVNAVCSFHATFHSTRLHPTLLNHDYAALGKVDIFQGLPQDEVQSANRRVFGMKRWNTKQVEVFQMLRGVAGNGFAFVEGIFGCGKTLVQAVLAKLLVDLGKHVLTVAPTNAEIQDISETLVKQAPDLSAVRIVFAEDAKKFSQQNDEPAQTKSKDPAVFRLLKDMNAFRTSRYNVVEEHDLQFQSKKMVEEMSRRGESLLFEYQREFEVVVDSDEFGWNDKKPDDEPPEVVDAIEAYTEFKSTNFATDPKPETKEERKAWEKTSRCSRKHLHCFRPN